MLYISLLFAFGLFLVMVYVLYNRKNKNQINDVQEKFNKTTETELLLQITKYKNQIDDLLKSLRELKINSNELKRINESLEAEISFLIEKQKKLEELSKKKEEFFAIYVHDLKNPASTIQNLIELLNSYELSFNEQKEIHNALFSLSNRIIHLTNEICKVVVENEISLNLILKSAKVQDILKKVYLRNIYKARKKDIGIFLSIPENIPDVTLDPDKIEDVIENLIDNAIKFSNSSKSVYIRLENDTDFIRIIIKDEGQGFNKEDMVNIFQKGATLSAKPTGNETSSGLGLWIVKKIIEDHKGNIKVESEPNEGSTFTIELPI